MAGAARLSLQCPLSHMRIVTPVRSVKCKHLECFDLSSYLQMARAARFPKFHCPRWARRRECPLVARVKRGA